MKIDGYTDIYGILGNPVHHSLSPVMHNAAFAACDLNSVYLPFPVDDLGAALQGLKGLSIKGVSVTIPHKEQVIPHLDHVDPVAARIRAVNTIRCERNGDNIMLSGFNTDWQGAIRPLQEKAELAGAEAVILGAGGSARAVGFGLLEAGATITLCSRTESRGRQLADEFGCSWQSLQDFSALKAKILVNTTSVGMAPQQDLSPVVQEALHHYEVVMDIVYAPLKTKLLSDAEEQGCFTINGLEMLLYQGAAQFEIWTGREAPVEVMRQALFEAVTIH
ncbi:MAG: shikimate dehydrogenase [Desulfocapsaceae bacterium]|nr:shikimate dehydrogenase [Desulfocapsaceae bacterium]